MFLPEFGSPHLSACTFEEEWPKKRGAGRNMIWQKNGEENERKRLQSLASLLCDTATPEILYVSHIPLRRSPPFFCLFIFLPEFPSPLLPAYTFVEERADSMSSQNFGFCCNASSSPNGRL